MTDPTSHQPRRRPLWTVVEIAAILIGLLAAFVVGRRNAAPAAADPAAAEPATPLGLEEGGERPADRPDWTAPTRVVVYDYWPGRTADLARAAPGLEVIVATDSAYAAAVATADGVLGPMNAAMLARASQLRWLQLPSAGIERYLELPGLRDGNIVLTNAQRIYGEGGGEHAIAMVMALARRLPASRDQQLAGEWKPDQISGGPAGDLTELRGRTLLVAGLGGIGTEVARIAKGLGMRVTATRNSSRTGPPFVDYVGLSAELPALAAEADVIVNVLPLTPETADVFNDSLFAVTKPGALFVNVGRGGTVDTDALLRALASGRLGGAGLDVMDPEPLPADHPLRTAPNVLITPHVGGDSDRAWERMWVLFEENIRRFAAGERLLSVVDKRRGY